MKNENSTCNRQPKAYNDLHGREIPQPTGCGAVPEIQTFFYGRTPAPLEARHLSSRVYSLISSGKVQALFLKIKRLLSCTAMLSWLCQYEKDAFDSAQIILDAEGELMEKTDLAIQTSKRLSIQRAGHPSTQTPLCLSIQKVGSLDVKTYPLLGCQRSTHACTKVHFMLAIVLFKIHRTHLS